MAGEKSNDWRRELKDQIIGAGETIINSADAIVNDNLDHVLSVEIKCDFPGLSKAPKISWTINKLNECVYKNIK